MAIERLSATGREGCNACPKCKERAGLALHSVPSHPAASPGAIKAWLQCDCGFTPFDELDRIETPDGVDLLLVAVAILTWNHKTAESLSSRVN